MARGSNGVYDWWSRHPRALDLLYVLAFLGRERRFRRRALETLAPSAGDVILEVGCGTGRGFGSLREAVGATGTVVGLDASRGMARAARRRVRDAGWRNVHVVRGDARRPPVSPEGIDAAYAAMSLSAVADPAEAIRATRTALRPGGRFVVLDARPFQRSPWTLANPLVVPAAKRLTNWVPEVDIPAVLRREFEHVDCATFNAGSMFVAHARKGSSGKKGGDRGPVGSSRAGGKRPPRITP